MLCSIVIISRAKVNYIIKKGREAGEGGSELFGKLYCTIECVWRKE